MAKSTCNPDVGAPKGMMKFEVIRSTIRDSIGQYCAPGDFAVLTKKEAKWYLDNNWIRVALPEFDVPDDEPEDESNSADEGGTDGGKRSEAASDTGGSTGEGRTRRPIKR